MAIHRYCLEQRSLKNHTGSIQSAEFRPGHAPPALIQAHSAVCGALAPFASESAPDLRHLAAIQEFHE
jgi:hypothetical protein